MTEADRAAIRIGFCRIELEVAGHRHRLHGKGFVRFDHINVAEPRRTEIKTKRNILNTDNKN